MLTWERVEVWRHSYVVSTYIATLPYVTLSCPILSCHLRYLLRVPVKITVQVLAAGCQLSYRKFYGFFTVQPPNRIVSLSGLFLVRYNSPAFTNDVLRFNVISILIQRCDSPNNIGFSDHLF